MFSPSFFLFFLLSLLFFFLLSLLFFFLLSLVFFFLFFFLPFLFFFRHFSAELYECIYFLNKLLPAGYFYIFSKLRIKLPYPLCNIIFILIYSQFEYLIIHRRQHACRLFQRADHYSVVKSKRIKLLRFYLLLNLFLFCLLCF